MKFLCEQCKAKYQISDDKVSGKTVRMKCRKCGHMIEVRADVTESSVAQKEPAAQTPNRAVPKPSSLTTALSTPPRSPRPATALSGALQKVATKDDGPSSALEILQASSSADWYAAINGVPVGPIRVSELRQKASQGLVTEETLVWQDGLEEWRPVKAMPELAQLVREAFQRQSLTPPVGEARVSRPPPAPPARRPITKPAVPVTSPKAVAAMAAAKAKGEPAGSFDAEVDAMFAAAAPTASMAPAAPIASSEITRAQGRPLTNGNGFASASAGLSKGNGAASSNGSNGNGSHAQLGAFAESNAGIDGRVSLTAADPFSVDAGASPFRQQFTQPMAMPGDARPSYIPAAPEARISVPPRSRPAGTPPWIIISVLFMMTAFGGVAAYALFFKPTVVQVQPGPATTVTVYLQPSAVAVAPTTDNTMELPSNPDKPNAGGGPRVAAKTAVGAPTATTKTIDTSLSDLAGGSGPDLKATKGPSGPGVSLTGDQVQTVVSQRQPFLKRTCWDRAPASVSNVSVKAKITVNGGGQVTNVNTSDNNEPSVASCIQKQVQGWTFPPTGASSELEIPFKFLRQ